VSHFAKVENGIITKVIVATQQEINTENHGDAFLWVQTSYNNNFRNVFTGIGGTYDKDSNSFISVKPYPSWVLNDETYQWEPPVAYPTRRDVNSFDWDESTTAWKIR